MSALTDLFTAMANKIRSKTGTATTYTPSEMVSDGIDDVYDAGVAAGGTSTPITPSNSSPASMTSGTKYTPSTNGYAIRSYDSVTPSSTPESVASGDIVKIGGSGVIVDAIPTPTSITPSNANPVALTANTAVTPTANGHAIESYTTVIPSATPAHVNADSMVRTSVYGGDIVSAIFPESPSNSNPTLLTSGLNYHADDNGYFIESYDSVTPSSTQTAVSSGDIVKIGGSGVIVDSVPTPTSITPSNSSPVALTADVPVNPSASGYAISSYSSVTPSNSSPVSLSSGSIYKMGGSGQAIANWNVATPSDTSPTAVSSTMFYKPTASGYVVKNNLANLSTAPSKTYTNANLANNASATITVTQKPRFIVLSLCNKTNAQSFLTGIINVNKGTAYRFGYWSSAFHNEDWSSGYSNYITSVSSSGVTVTNAYGNAVTIVVGCYY